MLINRLLKFNFLSQPFKNSRLNEEYKLLFCESYIRHIYSLNFEDHCQFLNIKYSMNKFSFEKFKEEISMMDSKSQFFLFQDYNDNSSPIILGIIIQQKYRKHYSIDAMYSDGTLFEFTSNEKLIKSKFRNQSTELLINKLFNDTLLTIGDKPLRFQSNSKLPRKNSVKVTILSSIGRFECEGSMKAFEKDDYGLKIFEFLRNKNQFKKKM